MNKIKSLKKIGKLALLLGLVTSLSSCSLIFDILLNGMASDFGDLGDIIDNDYSSYRQVDTPIERINDTREENRSGYNITFLQEKENEGYEILPSTGKQKVLVIPVYFKDYTPMACMSDPLVAIENINKAFFGESEDTGWESIKSYYYKSSYGKLELDGLVTSWCPINKTLEEVVSLTEYNDPTIYCLREAVKWAKQSYPNIEKDFDQDGDGFIDAVCLVYANDYYDGTGRQSYDRDYSRNVLSDVEDVLWAYTYWDYTEEPNVQSPIGNVYTWLSYDFLFDGKYTKEVQDGHIINVENLVDTHTYIHEFGHVLGLDDYYSYDGFDDEPLGKLDMMDNNIGDHNAYTKYLLNWIDPILIEEEGEYTITSLTNDGINALLIPADLEHFSYSPFSEYLLVELYTPTGLNELDSKNRYMGTTRSIPYHFTKTGVKILHVDSRLVVTDDSNKTYFYTNVFNDTLKSASKIQFVGASNTSSYSINPDFKLINLISSSKGRNAFDENYYATNRDLFMVNDMITEFNFNSGTKINFNIEVIAINQEEQTATISITNK